MRFANERSAPGAPGEDGVAVVAARSFLLPQEAAQLLPPPAHFDQRFPAVEFLGQANEARRLAGPAALADRLPAGTQPPLSLTLAFLHW